MRRAVVACVCAVAGLLLVSCTGPSAGRPAPETDGSPAESHTPATSSSVPANAPHVADPIDMTQYKQQPCSALSEAQLQKLSIPANPEPDLDAPEGPVCNWDAFDETGITLRGGPLTAGSSLAHSYKKNMQGRFENFKPITAVNYPGYLNWDNNISCTASVAVRNDLLYSLVARINDDMSHRGEQCEIARKAVKLATKRMSGNS